MLFFALELTCPYGLPKVCFFSNKERHIDLINKSRKPLSSLNMHTYMRFKEPFFYTEFEPKKECISLVKYHNHNLSYNVIWLFFSKLNSKLILYKKLIHYFSVKKSPLKLAIILKILTFTFCYNAQNQIWLSDNWPSNYSRFWNLLNFLNC